LLLIIKEYERASYTAECSLLISPVNRDKIPSLRQRNTEKSIKEFDIHGSMHHDIIYENNQQVATV
jgi:hypothetical protein